MSDPNTTIITRPAPTVLDLFTPTQAPAPTAAPGKGSEDFASNEVIIPRVQLLQAMSKAITERKLPGAAAGVWWLTPLNRPLCHPEGLHGLPTTVRIVVARIMPSQRRWRKLDEGGGLLCEASRGDLVAREPNGLTGAKLELDRDKKGALRGIMWEGGNPTDLCSQCCYGPGASAAASGRLNSEDSKDRSGMWLPKMINVDGEVVKLPDELRAPACTSGIDVLAYVLVPAFGDSPPELMPALITFSRTSMGAGKQLGSMIRLAVREPAWGKIYELGSQSVTNDKGTFAVASVRTCGYTTEQMQVMADQLYEDSKIRDYNAPWEDEGAETGATSSKKGDDNAPAPDPTDKF